MGVVKKAIKSAARLVGFDSDAIAAAGKAQADATTKVAADQASALREQGVQAQRSQETLQAQRQAADAAALLLDKSQGNPEVDISGGDDSANVDNTTGKRIRPRDAYTAKNSSITI